MAYVDDRFPKVGPFIVLIAMHDARGKRPQLYAKINYCNLERKEKVKDTFHCLQLKYWLKSGNLDLKHYLPEIYVNYALRTTGHLLDDTPSSVQLTRDSSCLTGLSVGIPVRWNSREVAANKLKPVKYGVCLHKALFGIDDPQLLVDWIEIHKALGIEKILVYFENITNAIPETVQRYVKEGLLQIFDWHMHKETRDYGQSGVMTECHYHFMHEVELLGTYDLDEVVVSQHNKTWDQMFNQFSKEYSDYNNIGIFHFNGLRWHTNFNESEHLARKEQFCPKAKLPVYFRKTKRDGHAWDHPKEIVQPLQTLQVQVHSSITLKNKKMQIVSPDSATCHHYRVEVEGINIKKGYFNNIMNRYKDQIISGVKKTMCSNK